jgi:hypothetical protein
VIAILACLALVVGVAAEPRQCQIDVCVTQTDLTAPRSEQRRDHYLGEPRVVTLFGRPACFRFGQFQAHTDGVLLTTGLGTLASGFEIEMLPLRLIDGRVRLEMWVAPAHGERGRKVTVDLKAGEWYRFRGPDGLRIAVRAAELPVEK